MRNLLILFVVGILALSSRSAFAQSFESPPPVPGWTHHQKFSSDTPQHHGVILSGKRINYSSPIIADIDGNPGNGKETVVTGTDGLVYALRSNGSVLWQYKISDSSCPNGQPSIMSSPAVGNLYGDGGQYVVAGYGGLDNKRCDGGVVALRGSDGNLAWRFSTKAFDKKEHVWAVNFGVISTPAVADVDNDGKMEVGFGSLDRSIYLLNGNGSVRWYYLAADTVFSSPAFANVDSDPDLEMIIGTDISRNVPMRIKNGGYVYAFKTKARKTKRIGFRDHSAYLWQRWFNQVIQSSPVVANVIPENPGPEIIVGSGCFFPQGSSKKTGAWFKVMDGRSGRVLRTLTTPICSNSSPAVGDIDEDGVVEVVATVNGLGSYGGDGKGRLMAWKPSTGERLWSMVPTAMIANDSALGTFMSPVVADVDGNGSLEVIVASNTGVVIVNGRDGRQLTCDARGCKDKPILLYAWSTFKGTPAIGDVNNDGLLDLVIGGTHPAAGSAVMYAWTGFAGRLGSTPGHFAPYSSSWPMHRGNAQRMGRY